MDQSILSALTDRGFGIFPVYANKVPATPHGFWDAVNTASEARRLFARYPNASLIGIATGNASGIDVLDIDQRPQAREWFADNRRRIPRTRAHRTRSGGIHLVFQHAPGMRCSTGRICIGVDVKAEGGCANYWPAAGLPILEASPPAPWPEWLLTLARPPALPPTRPVAVVSDCKIIRGILGVVGRAMEGERNRALYWAACRFAETTLAPDDATALLLDAALKIGLPVPEASGTIKSAFRAHARER
jgi:hypothetical protein